MLPTQNVPASAFCLPSRSAAGRLSIYLKCSEVFNNQLSPYLGQAHAGKIPAIQAIVNEGEMLFLPHGAAVVSPSDDEN